MVDNLARTAGLIAADTALLDELAADAFDKADVGVDELDVAQLKRLPAAVRTRVLHSWARRLGVSGGALSHRHIDAHGRTGHRLARAGPGGAARRAAGRSARAAG